ncbi:MAG: pantetheine-phosphate adenylyltransferase [Planctomycetes bacterium]|nr:pantetheine-phosphate adenylyltransferase [Alphaproteobacteria bacterium]MBM4016260.1 pantetheine-phosphate adenylyltransferase [Planctomycetota bacterium]
MSRRVGVYPGTFDPVTDGHMDIIRRATSICDHLVVGCARNAGKGPLFSLDERVAMVREEIQALGPDRAGRIEVVPFETLLTEFARSIGASFIIRGLRAVSDFEYEFQMVGMNSRLAPEVEIVFLMASETVHFISSRFVKEIGALGGDVSKFVSPRVTQRLKRRFAEKVRLAANAD